MPPETMAADDRRVPEAGATTSTQKGGHAPASNPQPRDQAEGATPATPAQELTHTELENEILLLIPPHLRGKGEALFKSLKAALREDSG